MARKIHMLNTLEACTHIYSLKWFGQKHTYQIASNYSQIKQIYSLQGCFCEKWDSHSSSLLMKSCKKKETHSCQEKTATCGFECHDAILAFYTCFSSSYLLLWLKAQTCRLLHQGFWPECYWAFSVIMEILVCMSLPGESPGKHLPSLPSTSPFTPTLTCSVGDSLPVIFSPTPPVKHKYYPGEEIFWSTNIFTQLSS